MINITVGIPLYNAELYISKTLESILSQSFTGMEVLVVDDCGTDNSAEIVKHIKETSTNGDIIRIIKHNKNKGVAESRNTIIKESKGKYLFFVDADDIISKEALPLLFTKAEKYQAEVVFSSFNILKNGNLDVFRQLPDLVLIGEDKLADYFYNGHKDNILCSSCNILILKSFIIENDITFPQKNYAEDLLFDYYMFPLIRRAVLVSNLTYTYIIHSNSLSNYQSRKTIDINEAQRALENAQLIKNTCKGLHNKSYFPNKCVKDLKQILYFICGIIKHRKQFNGIISNKDLRNAIKHPASIYEILRFKQQRMINLIFYVIGILPASISIKIITIIGKKQGYI